MWSQYLSILLGAWLMAAPDILGYGNPAQANDRIIGPIALSLALIAIAEVTRGVRWVNLVSGAWLVVAPWILAYPETVAIVNSMAIGLSLAALVPFGGDVKTRFGGGWSSLVRSGDSTVGD